MLPPCSAFMPGRRASGAGGPGPGRKLGPRRRQPLTTIVPFIWVGWIAQWYGYVPASVNCRLPLFPGWIVSVAHDRSSNAAEWGVVSSFVQVIVSPTLAWIGSVLKLKSLISTFTVPAASLLTQATAPTEGAGAFEVGVALEPHAASAIPTTRVRGARTTACMDRFLLQGGVGDGPPAIKDAHQSSPDRTVPRRAPKRCGGPAKVATWSARSPSTRRSLGAACCTRRASSQRLAGSS